MFKKVELKVAKFRNSLAVDLGIKILIIVKFQNLIKLWQTLMVLLNKRSKMLSIPKVQVLNQDQIQMRLISAIMST